MPFSAKRRPIRLDKPGRLLFVKDPKECAYGDKTEGPYWEFSFQDEQYSDPILITAWRATLPAADIVAVVKSSLAGRVEEKWLNKRWDTSVGPRIVRMIERYKGNAQPRQPEASRLTGQATAAPTRELVAVG